MNTDTKRHIDSARQVLVGVVPNPTSQIDQITNALIYKFMDDMDQASIKLGGNPSFFVGDLEKYAWTRLMDTRMGNQERMNLYGEALVKFSQAKQLPELFREIFKSAFLPYRSPETLGMFLKEIDYFDYSHPEELGNAYEYLLSIMSSQGDAGQFRTPRHIIDFIVDVVNPTKNDKVLDPACGTGGFLVSAYNHILEQHDCKNDPKKKEKPLTPDERKKLIQNFEGYDIDPTMVRISKVNMYLHKFTNPKIFQYDTLSSDDRWNDKFDVILANPPFMSPKGGIKPHSKFSIQSSRSEVLFVDYIMNHLRPKGRAGIIVPEGIIFQSATAHKQLRKNLVEDGLYAVISLPSGVFAPYSGVKTSILLFNNELAKTKQEILFIKIENYGLSLGANKKTISENDLPTALEILNKWNIGKKVENKLAVYVEKTKIAEDGDYNLSADRYRLSIDYTNTKWPMIELLELENDNKIEFLRGQGLSKNDLNEKGKNSCIHYGEIYTLYDPIIKFVLSKTNFKGKITSLKGDCLVPATTTADAMGIAVARSLNIDDVIIGGDINIIRTRNEYVLSDYLANLISNPPLKLELSKSAKGANILHLSNSDLRRLKIPLPPLEIQEQIVAELNGYQNIITGAKQITENWKPKIEVDPKWGKVKIGDICKIERGASPRPINKYITANPNGFNWIKIGDTKNSDKYITQTAEKITKAGAEKSRKVFVGDFILSNSMSFGHPYIMKIEGYIHDGWLRLSEDLTRIGKDFLYYVLCSDIVIAQFENVATGGVVRNLNSELVRNVEIPLPSLKVQKEIVEKIEAERNLVESAKKLIEIYEQKTKVVIAKLWTK